MPPTSLIDMCRKHNYFKAVREGNVEIVLTFIKLDEKRYLNTLTDEGASVLYLAISHGHPKMVEMLVSEGIDIYRRYRAGLTYLHLAARNGNKDIYDFLISRGLNIQDSIIDPLQLAAIYGHIHFAL